MPSTAVTTSSSQIIPPGLRQGVILQNLSDTDIYISTQAAVTVADGANAGLKLAAAGGMMAVSNLPSSSSPFYGIHAGTGTKQLRYLTT